MNRERAWNIITLLCFINLVLLAFKFLTRSPIKEPEFINSYCIMTSDDSFESLPREIGTIKRHENIVSNATGGVGNVSSSVTTAGALAGTKGMDIVLEGGHSSYVVPKDMKTISLVIKAKDNDIDPMELYRIVRFNGSKKDRCIQWMEFSPALLGNEKAQKSGYVNFIAHKYGEQSYILTFPEKEMIPGEYGIFLSAVNGTTIPIGTFSIPK
jgi:hypothetical protein BACCOPRO_02305